MKHSIRTLSLTTLAFLVSLAITARANSQSDLLSSALRAHGGAHPSQTAKLFHFLPAETYVLDDGTAEDAIGLTLGGDVISLNQFTVIPGEDTINSISIAWGTPAFPDPSLDGLPYTAVLWSDPNGDGSPFDATVLATADGVVGQQGTDTFLITPITPTGVATSFFVGFIIPNTLAGQFPAAFDESAPIFNRSWVAGGSSGTGNIDNLNDNEIPVALIESFGLFGNWLIRADAGASVFQLTNAVSTKAKFDIELPGVEDRIGGPNNTYQIIFTFSGDLASVGGTQVKGCPGAVVSSSAINTKDAHQFVVTLTNVVCDQHEMTIRLTNVTDTQGNNLASATTTMGLLIGDANGDGTVDNTDIHQVVTNIGQLVTEDNFRDDLNVDNFISRGDVNLVRSNLGHSLP